MGGSEGKLKRVTEEGSTVAQDNEKLPKVQDEMENCGREVTGIGIQGLGQPVEGLALQTSNQRKGEGEPESEIEQWWSRGIEQVSSCSFSSLDLCIQYLKAKGINLDQYNGKIDMCHGPFKIKGSRWYLPVQIRNRTANFLVDPGASMTVISKDFYETIEREQDEKCALTFARNADGTQLITYGQMILPITLGELEYVTAPFVADISDSGILGLDFLAMYDADLGNLNGQLLIRQPVVQILQCTLIAVTTIGTAKRTETIPPKEVRYVEIEDSGERLNSIALIEPDLGFLKEKGLSGLPTLTAPKGSRRLPVRNDTDRTIEIEQGVIIGTCSPVERIEMPKTTPEPTPCTELPNHLQNLILDSDLSEKEDKEHLRKLLKDYQDVFAIPGEELGRTHVVEHGIDTGTASPIRQPYRRLPLSKKEEVERELQQMLEQGIISDSTSPWASPVVLVRKKDGSCRFCIDYRALNEVTKKNAFPIPRIDENLDYLGGNRWFCTLDLQSGYWQIGMKEEDKEKTAFITHKGLYEFNVMAFGLCNAPATFQRMMSIMLNGLIGITCLVYLDDVIIFGETQQECLSNLKGVLQRLRQYSLKLRPKKCHLFKREVEYLGRIVSSEGVRTDPEKIKAVLGWPEPHTVKEIKSFLGFCSYYREFIPAFSDIAAPLISLTKKTPGPGIVELTPEAKQAMKELKNAFTKTPLLGFPQGTGTYILDTDASLTSIGGVLSQIQNGKEVPICFASHRLNRAQMNYCTTKKELLAIVVYAKRFRHYLFGTDFKIRTDHASLKWLLNFKEAEGIMGRWLSQLSELGVTNSSILHRKGKQHINADALSRRPTRKCPRKDCQDCISPELEMAGLTSLGGPQFITKPQDELRRAQDTDPIIGIVKKKIEKGQEKPTRPEISKEPRELRYLYSYWNQLTIKNGLLCRWKKIKGKKRRFPQIILPLSLRKEVLEWCHGSPTTGHLGLRRCLDSLCQRYWWPEIKKDTQRWIRACPSCIESKAGQGKGKSPLTQEIFGVRFSRIALDILTGLRTSERGNTCIMVIQDYFSKYTQAYSLPDHTAATCAETLMKWILLFGTPLAIHSDQGREFESELWKQLCLKLGINKTRTNAYRPQSDGMVERFNRTLISELTCVVNKHLDDWDEYIPYITHAYNSTPHSTTNCSPNLLVFGTEITMPPDLVYGNPNIPPLDPCPVLFVENLRQQFREGYAIARDYLEKNANYQKKVYDVGLKTHKIMPGDQVMRFNVPASQTKLSRNWDGP